MFHQNSSKMEGQCLQIDLQRTASLHILLLCVKHFLSDCLVPARVGVVPTMVREHQGILLYSDELNTDDFRSWFLCFAHSQEVVGPGNL